MSEEQQEIRKFVRGGNKKYSLTEKHELGQILKKYKSEYDDYVTQNQNRNNYNDKLITTTNGKATKRGIYGKGRAGILFGLERCET